MGYFGKLGLRLEAQDLRRKGLSYQDILQNIHVSKNTISRWCKDVVLTPEQQAHLIQKKQFGQKKGSVVAAANKKRKKHEVLVQHLVAAQQDLGELSTRDKFIAGLALYAGEGTKGDGKAGFANSNPLLIEFMMDWFRKYSLVLEKQFRGAIWIHEGLDENAAKKFWSSLTGIPQDQFHKTYVAQVKTSSKKITKNIHQFGVFSICFSDSYKHRQIMSWISALFTGKITSVL